MHFKKIFNLDQFFRLIFLCLKFLKESCLIGGPVKTQQCFGKPDFLYCCTTIFILENGVLCLEVSTELIMSYYTFQSFILDDFCRFCRNINLNLYLMPDD